jgi:hypothetical protein
LANNVQNSASDACSSIISDSSRLNAISVITAERLDKCSGTSDIWSDFTGLPRPAVEGLVTAAAALAAIVCGFSFLAFVVKRRAYRQTMGRWLERDL